MNDTRVDYQHISRGLRHAAESIRMATIGWNGSGVGGRASELCADLYACAGVFESQARHVAALEADCAAALRGVRFHDESGDSLVSTCEVSTYVLPRDCARSTRVGLLEQAAGIVATVIATIEADEFDGASIHRMRLVELSEEIGHVVRLAVAGDDE